MIAAIFLLSCVVVHAEAQVGSAPTAPAIDDDLWKDYIVKLTQYYIKNGNKCVDVLEKLQTAVGANSGAEKLTSVKAVLVGDSTTMQYNDAKLTCRETYLTDTLTEDLGCHLDYDLYHGTSLKQINFGSAANAFIWCRKTCKMCITSENDGTFGKYDSSKKMLVQSDGSSGVTLKFLLDKELELETAGNSLNVNVEYVCSNMVIKAGGDKDDFCKTPDGCMYCRKYCNSGTKVCSERTNLKNSVDYLYETTPAATG